jgi:hypothetical protein
MFVIALKTSSVGSPLKSTERGQHICGGNIVSYSRPTQESGCIRQGK